MVWKVWKGYSDTTWSLGTARRKVRLTREGSEKCGRAVYIPNAESLCHCLRSDTYNSFNGSKGLWRFPHSWWNATTQIRSVISAIGRLSPIRLRWYRVASDSYGITAEAARS